MLTKAYVCAVWGCGGCGGCKRAKGARSRADGRETVVSEGVQSVDVEGRRTAARGGRELDLYTRSAQPAKIQQNKSSLISFGISILGTGKILRILLSRCPHHPGIPLEYRMLPKYGTMRSGIAKVITRRGRLGLSLFWIPCFCQTITGSRASKPAPVPMHEQGSQGRQ